MAAIFRDYGNRADRRHARLKYLLAEWGMDRFRAEFERRRDAIGPKLAGTRAVARQLRESKVARPFELDVERAVETGLIQHRPARDCP